MMHLKLGGVSCRACEGGKMKRTWRQGDPQAAAALVATAGEGKGRVKTRRGELLGEGPR